MQQRSSNSFAHDNTEMIQHTHFNIKINVVACFRDEVNVPHSLPFFIYVGTVWFISESEMIFKFKWSLISKAGIYNYRFRARNWISL